MFAARWLVPFNPYPTIFGFSIGDCADVFDSGSIAFDIPHLQRAEKNMSGEKMGGAAPRSQRKARQQLDRWNLTFRSPLPLSINIINVLFPATLFELFPLGRMLAFIQRGVGGFQVCEQQSERDSLHF